MNNEQNTNVTPDAQVTPEVKPEAAPEVKPKFDINDPEIKMLLQKEGDRRVSSVANELKATRDALEELKKSQMSEAQRSKYESEQKELKALEERNQLQNQLKQYMAKAELSRRGWPEDMLAHLIGDNEEEIKAKADALSMLIDKAAESRVGAHLNQAGIRPATTVNTTTAPTAVDLNDPSAVYEAVKSGRLKLSAPT